MERALSFAPEVSQDELTKTIKDLEAFVTRDTLGKGGEDARKYPVERLQDDGYTAELDSLHGFK